MKKYLKEMNEKELEKLLDENTSLQDYISEYMYNFDLEIQHQELIDVLGNAKKYYDYNDDYSSFFLTLKEIDLIDNIGCTDYFTEKTRRLYYKAIEKKKEYDVLVEKCKDDDIAYNDTFNAIEEFLKSFEEQLHDYEKVYSYNNDKYEMLDNFLQMIDRWDDYYIIDDDFTKVYHDITTTNKF